MSALSLSRVPMTDIAPPCRTRTAQVVPVCPLAQNRPRVIASAAPSAATVAAGR
jgi:hypothetical protein